MGLDTILAVIALGAFAYYCLWEDVIRPLLTRGGRVETAESVNTSAPRRLPRLRSRRSARSNAANAGSAHSSAAGEGSNVRPNVQLQAAIAAPAGAPAGPAAAGGQPANVLTLTPDELRQLSAAVAARQGGATVEEAILAGFGARKGGSAAYKRARELFAVATEAP